MKRFILLAFSTAITILCFTTLATATTFTAADLSGHWRGYWLETTEDGDDNFTDEARYWLQVDAEIDATGAFSSGTWTSSGGFDGNVTGGTLSIASDGSITGTMNIGYTGDIRPAETVNIAMGQMDLGKQMVYLGFEKAGGKSGCAVLTQYAANGFNTSRLEGEWEAILLETDPSDNNATYWVEAEVGINSSGSGVGFWNYRGVANGFINASPFTLDTFGQLGGTLNLDTGDTVTINGGQLDPQVNCGSFATTKDSGELAGGIIIRTDGNDYTTSDLQGTWAIYRTATYDEQQMCWVGGEITFDDSGNMTSGSWVAPSGNTGSYTAASFAVAAIGKLSGSYSTDNGNTLTLDGGYMGLSRTHAVAVSKSNDGILEVVFMIKKADNATIFPAVNLLLD